MRRIGTLPKLFGKYNISRYNSSHDAEYKSAYADEYTHSRPFQNMTTADQYPFYLVSNQGLIGTAGHDPWFEEDFRANAYNALPDTPAKNRFAFHGGYVALLNSTAQGTSLFGEMAFIPNGNVFSSWRPGFASGSITEIAATPYCTHQSIFVYWGSDNLGRLDSSWNPWDKSTATRSTTANAWEYFYEGVKKFQSGGTLSGYSIVRAYNSAYARQVQGTGVQRCVLFSPNVTITSMPTGNAARGTFIEGTGTEICLVPTWNGSNTSGGWVHRLFSMESGIFIDPGFVIASSFVQYIEGRYVLLRRSFDSTDYVLLHYDPETDTLTTIGENLPNNSRLTGNNAFGFLYTITTNESGETYLTGDLYYKTRKVRENWSTRWGDMRLTFGSCLYDSETGTAINYETGETRDFSVLAGLPSRSSLFAPSAGLYAEIAGIAESIWNDADLYIVSWSKIQKIRTDWSKYFFYPNERHAKAVYWFKDQVFYIIGKDGYRAYDMQTFMRLDNLPGFQGAVELVQDFTV